MNGDTAMAYARIRKIDSDWKRIERQRTVIQAAINQVKNSDIFTLNALADAILPMVQTNLTKAEITRLMLEVPAFLSEGSKMEQMTIPTYETCWNSIGVDGRKMIGVDFEANAQILREFSTVPLTILPNSQYFYPGDLNEEIYTEWESI